MKDHIRIYNNEQCIFITAKANQLVGKQALGNVWIVRNADRQEWKGLFLKFLQSSFENLIIEGDAQELFNEFKDSFKLILAGGGVVWNELDELLMIHRLGKWDLPKGKIEEAEKVEDGALREVEEETHVQNIRLVKFFKTTYHIYELKGRWILKQTEWFEMQAVKQTLVPQSEENIDKAVWVKKELIDERLQNSYPNIIYLLQNGLKSRKPS